MFNKNLLWVDGSGKSLKADHSPLALSGEKLMAVQWSVGFKAPDSRCPSKCEDIKML